MNKIIIFENNASIEVDKCDNIVSVDYEDEDGSLNIYYNTKKNTISTYHIPDKYANDYIVIDLLLCLIGIHLTDLYDCRILRVNTNTLNYIRKELDNADCITDNIDIHELFERVIHL